MRPVGRLVILSLVVSLLLLGSLALFMTQPWDVSSRGPFSHPLIRSFVHKPQPCGYTILDCYGSSYDPFTIMGNVLTWITVAAIGIVILDAVLGRRFGFISSSKYSKDPS